MSRLPRARSFETDPRAPSAWGRPWSMASFRSSLVPMVIADDERRYVAANTAACLLLRTTEEDVLELTIEDLTPPQSRSVVPAIWEEFVREGTQKGIFELLTPDGVRIRVEYSASANVLPGRHLAIWMFPAGSERRARRKVENSAMLTAREREVLGMVAMGMGSSWIASALGVSTATVETHVRHCLEKLGARNRAHAIALGVHAGEITLDLPDVRAGT
jgi:PAS domain S-box-containing protein